MTAGKKAPASGRQAARKAAPLRRGSPRGQVLVCGLGLRLPHLTLEAAQALKECRTVFHPGLDAETKNYVKSLCRGLRALGGPGRPEDPEAMAAAVLSAAAAGGAAAFLCPGNPAMFQGGLLIRRCKAAGIPCRVIAGISPLDELLAALGAPVLEYGLQVYPAGAVSRAIQLLPRAPAAVLELDSLWSPRKAGPAGFAKLLAAAYPPGHKVTLIRRPAAPSAPVLRRETCLAGLAGELRELRGAERRGAALFIPAPGHAEAGLFRDGSSGAAGKERLLICGLGLRLGHLTRETALGLKRCRTVFHNFLDERTKRYVRALCPDLRSMRDYRRKAEEGAEADAVMRALSDGRTVAFLGSGHPLVLQGTVNALMRRCLAAKVPYRILPALSSLDEVLPAAGAPALGNGLHVCPVNELAGRNFPLSPRIPALILGLHHLWDPAGTGVAGLLEHLYGFYPRDHRVLLVHCSHTESDPGARLETPLRALAGALESFSEADRFAVSLFIPALPRAEKRTARGRPGTRK